MKREHGARLSLLSAMLLFGTIGIFRKYIPLPSGVVACVRGLIGMLFLLLVMAVRKERFDRRAIRSNFLFLALSGMLIGVNWVLLFEAYRFTTVATATLCYYMAPLFVMLAAPFVLKERITWKKIACMLVAFVGMVLVSGVLDAGFSGASELTGVLLGLGAAAFYASVVLLNKKIQGISAISKTAIQLGFAGLTVFPYTLLAESVTQAPTAPTLLLLLVVGIVHTGLAYTLYFGSMDGLSAQTIVLFSYLDPIVAILLSVLFLQEPMTLLSAIGAVLILGSTVWSELS